ncbi:unnamed protein product [Owenia fusiformis]|uniref:Tyrosine-protein phosphatase non-receptor type 9 n=1 Tax=Owenia fusiformis TaxID=6347 RepID=A0A8S4PVA7_OWEFU|nr:unnamed protein product [Owenia fusiformis]
MAANLTREEEQRVKLFTDEVNLHRHRLQQGAIAWKYAVKFLMARKFDVKRAIELYLAHQDIRNIEGVDLIDDNDAAFQQELASQKLTILPSRDSRGACIALLTARLHNPAQTKHQLVMKSLILQLDTALESYTTQRNGMVFIYDMTESKYSNFDYDLSIKILNVLKERYPARLKKVLIVTAPLWFKAPFKILRLFVREKLRDRVHTVNIKTLSAHISRDSLPRQLGGTLEVHHGQWLRCCMATSSSQNTDIRNDIDNYFHTYIEPPSLTPDGSSSGSQIHDTNLVISDMESETSKETVSEKHSDEDREKEVTVEKDNVKSPGAPEKPPLKRQRSPASVRLGEQHKNVPSLPCKKKSPADKDDFEESIHQPDANGLTVEQLETYTRRKTRRGLCKDYMTIKAERPAGTFNNARLKNNIAKNRYSDVLCLDHSRVRVTPVDENNTDYINANFVDGYKQKNAYISTQGPNPKTFAEFWTMVWEQRVLVVVMTTKTIERGRLKCGQYWPLEEETAEEYGDYIVINSGSRREENYTLTTLILQNLKTGESHDISHFQYLVWPDYGVPHTASAFLEFLFAVRKQQAERTLELGSSWQGHPLGPPMVIHCSAGIGRTGTFCTMDISIRRLADTGLTDIPTTVRKIRSQRAHSIQMPDQYVFCHLALLEHAQSIGLVPELNLTGFEDSSSEDD